MHARCMQKPQATCRRAGGGQAAGIKTESLTAAGFSTVTTSGSFGRWAMATSLRFRRMSSGVILRFQPGHRFAATVTTGQVLPVHDFADCMNRTRSGA